MHFKVQYVIFPTTSLSEYQSFHNIELNIDRFDSHQPITAGYDEFHQQYYCAIMMLLFQVYNKHKRNISGNAHRRHL